jgi:tetratricopeptide (TPR) repeat protein
MRAMNELTKTKLKEAVQKEGERIGSLARRSRTIEVGVVFILSLFWGFWAVFSGVSLTNALTMYLGLVIFLVLIVPLFCNRPVARALRALQGGRMEEAKLEVRRAMRLNLALFPISAVSLMYSFDAQVRLLLAQSQFVQAEVFSKVILVAYDRFRLLRRRAAVEVMFKNFIALAYLGQGRFLEARDLFKECLERTRPQISKTVILNNIGYCELELGNIDQAYKMLSASVTGANKRTLHEKAIFMGVNSNMARACVRKSLLEEAEERVEGCIELADQIKASAAQRGIAYEACGDLRLAQARNEEAEHHYRSAIDALRGVLSDTHPTMIRITTSLATVLEKEGKTEESSRLFQKAAADHEALQQQIMESVASICDQGAHFSITMV